MLTNSSSPNHGIQHNSSGFFQVFRYQDFPHGAIKPGDFDAVCAGVRPVQVAGHPVHGNAIGVRDLSRDHELAAWAVEEGAADSPHFVICPVDVSFQGIKVNGDGMPDVLQRQHNVREIRGVQGNAPQVCPAGQEQQCGGACRDRTNTKALQTLCKNAGNRESESVLSQQYGLATLISQDLTELLGTSREFHSKASNMKLLTMFVLFLCRTSQMCLQRKFSSSFLFQNVSCCTHSLSI